MTESSLSALSASQMQISLPSLATYSGSRPSNSQAAATSGFTGIAASSNHADIGLRAISFSVAASPPRVGSRSTAIPAPPRSCRQPVRAARQSRKGFRFRIPGSRASTGSRRRGRRSSRRAGSPARPRIVRRDMHAFGHHAETGRGDEDAVALALLDHLGVAGNDGTPASAARAIEATIRARDRLSGKPSSRMKPAVK
jgi:hypothetical protein